MSAEWAVGGAVLLAAATLPQVSRLVRTRSADDFTMAFALLNFLGILLLAARSAEIGEAAFLVVNLIGAAFWGLLLCYKVAPRRSPGALSADPAAS